ncbi:MAG: glycoside hydrolase family 31 protein [Bacteroidia bacterium]
MLRLHILGEAVVRFRFATEGYFARDFSYAIDPALAPAHTPVSVEEHPEYIRVQTALLDIRLERSGLRTTILDAQGQLLSEDDKGFHWVGSELGGNLVFMSKRAQPDESYFGLGDKTCPLNLRGERLQNWATDCFGYSATTDPLYRAIPFYYGLHEGRAYGVFFDNSFRSFFDFAAERDNATSFWAHGGEMNYYFIHGPGLMEVAERYAWLTGRAELPPQWAMGFHQCKWSYYPEARVRSLAAEFRQRQIPCDAIYLDIDYMDGYRCFTWNRTHFPDPAGMIRDLARDGFHTVVIIDPGIKIDPDYAVYREGLARELYLRRPDGPFVRGKVWPGECYFPDFTLPEARSWWAGLFRDLIRRDGVHGVWNDMNEPAVFEVETRTLVSDVRHDYDGHPCSHRKAHNVYGMQMSRASQEGVKAFAYPNRPFMITRATYAGGQRYAAVWTGDNVASWEHLRLATIQCQRLSVSGFSFCGSDIGGFNDTPDGELFIRWLQLGIFHPLCRVHSIGYNDTGNEAVDDSAVAENMASGRNRDQEPWSFGEPYTSIARQTIGLRYRLLPHLYTAFWQYVQRGTPVLRPISFIDQHDPETLLRMEEFGVGDHLLVCPISERGAKGRYLYLPRGQWYDFRNSRRIPGGQEIWTAATLAEVPVYVRAGAVLALGPVRQHTGDLPDAPLELHLYYGTETLRSELYLDAGEGYDHDAGVCSHRVFVSEAPGNQWRIVQQRSGSYEARFAHFTATLHGVPPRMRYCRIDGQRVGFVRKGEAISIQLPRDFAELVLE